MNKLKCYFGFHKYTTDRTLTDGVLWRFCDHCGCRQRLTGDKGWHYF